MATAGLESNTITDIVTEPDGVAWLATDWGLCRGESGTWTVLNTGNSGLPDNWVRSLALDDQGRLWIGTNVAGAVLYDGLSWQVFNTQNSPLPDDQVNVIHIDHQGWVWLGTVGGLACYTGTEWRVYDSSPQSHQGLSLNGDNILSIDTRPDGLVALGTLNGGFHFLTDTAVHYYTTFNFGFFDNTQLGVLLDTGTNERWLACPAGALVRQIGDWYGGPWFQYTTLNSDLPSNALSDLTGDGAGGLWIGAQVGGLIRRTSGGSYSSFTTTNSGIPSNNLRCVHRAEDGAIWVGTQDAGAARFNPSASAGTGPAQEPAVMVSPSPNGGAFTVLASAWEGEARWEVFDPLGRSVAGGVTAALHGLQVVLPEALSGACFLRVTANRTSTVRRFMVH